MLYTGDEVIIIHAGTHYGKRAVVISGEYRTYGTKRVMKYMVETAVRKGWKSHTLMYTEKYLKLCKAQSDNTLLNWLDGVGV